jgi:hypothetical protein
MSAKLITPPNSIGSAYEDLMEAFRSALENANVEVAFPSRPIRSCFTARSGNAVVFERCLSLKNCPCRKLSRDRRLAIVIKALEVLERQSWEDWIVKKSSVYLNYVVVGDGMAELVQSLHYDFVAGGQDDHPFFHLQLTGEAIPEADRREAGFELPLEIPNPPSRCWVTTRIPTPDMTLASVLYCVVADHLGAGIFREFARKVEAIQDRLPIPGFEDLRDSLLPSVKHFKSSHWFAHMKLLSV